MSGDRSHRQPPRSAFQRHYNVAKAPGKRPQVTDGPPSAMGRLRPFMIKAPSANSGTAHFGVPVNVRFWGKADMPFCTAHVSAFDPKRTFLSRVVGISWGDSNP